MLISRNITDIVTWEIRGSHSYDDDDDDDNDDDDDADLLTFDDVYISVYSYGRFGEACCLCLVFYGAQ